MQFNTYSTSTNIIRDQDREIIYHTTPNAIRVVDQISNDFKKGLRSFNIIGSYGTGKSSFLWALEKSLKGQKNYFDARLVEKPTVKVINFIGEYKSITQSFADYFDIEKDVDTPKFIIHKLHSLYQEISQSNKLLLIIIDEFGKFLEYAAKNLPESELYFIQQLTEFINNSDLNICLITAVHQNISAYAHGLDGIQRQEWLKIKGRFREITFNEPIEQLLLLAAKHLNNEQAIKSKDALRQAITIAKQSKVLKLSTEFTKEVAGKLYPLDLLAANVLTISLQKYGQNERSLFSFLESTDHTGINSITISNSNPFFNVADVYDYLNYNFYSFLNSKDNPDYLAWLGIRSALESVERSFEESLTSYDKLVKTIGLLAITAPKGSVLNDDFILKYAKICLGIQEPGILLTNLEVKKIILERKYNNRYVLFDGTDLDIQLALNEAGNIVSQVNDVTTLLKRYYDLAPVLAKMYSYVYGTPRLFEYRISEVPISEIPANETDGFINLVFDETLKLDKLKQFSLNQVEAIIYGYYQNAKRIREQLFEIEKTQKVIETHSEDKVVVRELNNVLVHQKNLLNHYILDGHYNGEVIWIFRGEEQIVKGPKDFNKLLSHVCMRIYDRTPSFKNELVNKHKISSSIHSAKRNFLQALVRNWNVPDLGFAKDKFPAEKTIYITLLKENGIHSLAGDATFVPSVANNSTFRPLWDISEEFIASAKHTRRKVSELVTLLSKKPFKLKQGLIDFWLPTLLFAKRDDYALFNEGTYVAYLTEDILELVVKNPHKYEIKAFDLEGVRLDLFNSYRQLLNQSNSLQFSNETFIETIKPFLVFYSSLPFYSKNTKRLSKEALSIRDAIARSTDPEKTFFEDFPTALGYSIEILQNKSRILEIYTETLQTAIREIRTSYDELLNRFEEFIIHDLIGQEVTFEGYKSALKNRYLKVKKHLLISYQKTFVQRIESELDDRNAWLNSIAQAVIGKSLDVLKDEEELILYDKFKRLILDLDSLTSLTKVDLNVETEDVLSLEIGSLVDGIQKNFVRMPNAKKVKANELAETIRTKLSGDITLDIAALTEVLKNLLKSQ
ncbi:hypothetical protein [Siphonobacter sp. BAB-5405]|uniref:hypothetical protein n=1 Tax=Siphonobacter sp. BAB-5405 TaxID=1864825 RepID=UPI001E5EA660|nr:hypothetical protein [Siphonobacter sp. BAB-5405]